MILKVRSFSIRDRQGVHIKLTVSLFYCSVSAQLYPKELEEVLNHKQFCIPFRNIPLYKGKQKEDEESPESRLAGFLKVSFV